MQKGAEVAVGGVSEADSVPRGCLAKSSDGAVELRGAFGGCGYEVEDRACLGRLAVETVWVEGTQTSNPGRLLL